MIAEGRAVRAGACDCPFEGRASAPTQACGTLLRDDPGWWKRSSNARMQAVRGEGALVHTAATTQLEIVNRLDLVVRAVDCGWLIDGPTLGQPLAFFSGRQAEAKAHELGRVMAAAGHDVRVEVRDRMQKVVGATRYSPGLPASRAVGRIRAAEAPARIA